MESKTVWPEMGGDAWETPAESAYVPTAITMDSRPARVLDLEGNCDPESEPALSPEELLQFYTAMVRTRVFDTRAVNLHRQGRVGFFVPSFGEEAAQIASAAVMEPEDWIFPQYRETGVALFRGYPVD